MSTYPRGRVKRYSVIDHSQDTGNVLMSDSEFLDPDLIAVSLGLWAGDLDGPGGSEIPLRYCFEILIIHVNRTLFSGILHLSVFYQLAPLPKIHAAGDAALERDVFPLQAARLFEDDLMTVFGHHFLLDHFMFRAQARTFGEVTCDHAISDIDSKMESNKGIFSFSHFLFLLDVMPQH